MVVKSEVPDRYGQPDTTDWNASREHYAKTSGKKSISAGEQLEHGSTALLFGARAIAGVTSSGRYHIGGYDRSILNL
jgi:hypothetical protein